MKIDCKRQSYSLYISYSNSVKWHVIYTISKRDLYDHYDGDMSQKDIKQVK